MAIIGIVFVGTGISLWHTPSDEVLFTHTCLMIPPITNGSERVTVMHKIELGNTGKNVQDDVKVRLLRTAVKRSIRQPSVLNFDVSRCPFTMTENSDEIVIAIGRLEPEKRVTITVIPVYGPGVLPDPPSRVLLSVEPACGKARPGNPGMTIVGRAWFSLYDLFHF
jgi:hypothetical protein